MVFGQVTTSNAPVIRLRVARVTPHPPPKPVPSRVPRPDDPIPRRPPLINRTKSVSASTLTRGLKRAASSSYNNLTLAALPGDSSILTKKQKLTNGNPKDVSKSSNPADEVFKVPPLPGKAKGKAKEKDDLFGSVLKRKPSAGDLGKGPGLEETEVERINKNVRCFANNSRPESHNRITCLAYQKGIT